MTTTTTLASTSAIASGLAPIPFDFQAISDAEVGVRRAGVELSPFNYTVALNGDGTGVVTPLADWGADSIEIYSNPSYEQPANFSRFGAFYPDQFVPPLDRLARTILALRDRSFLRDPGASPLDFAGMFIAGDAEGKPIPASGTGADAALRTDLGTLGASLLAYLPADGVAAVNLETALRLGLPVTPEFFGAPADGINDDYPAIAAAITHLTNIGGGTLKFGPKLYVSSQKITWNGAIITVEGTGASVQPGAGTIIYFPNSATQTGCINPQNGALGKGSGSSVRNLTIKGANGAAVSAADAKLGKGSGLLAQAYGLYVNIIAMHCEGNGIYGLSSTGVSDNAINLNGANFIACIGYANKNNGRATYGVDSNAVNFVGGGAQQNAQFGDYINGSAGSTIEAPLYEGNGVGPLRFGDITGRNRVIGASYKEEDVALLVQFDAGGAGQNKVEWGLAQGTVAAPATIVIVDNTAAQDNDVNVFGVQRTIRMGGDGANGTVNVTAGGDLQIRNGAKATFDDPSVTSHQSITNSGGTLLHYTDQNFGGIFYTAASPVFSYDASGIKAGGDNIKTLGGPSNRFSTVYAGTGAINTSDERHKLNIAEVDDAALDAWGEVDWTQFQYDDAVEKKGADGARLHTGIIAQRVRKAFKKHGLDPFKYGILCHDRWKSQYEPVFEQAEREVVCGRKIKTVMRGGREVKVEVPVTKKMMVGEIKRNAKGKPVMKLVKKAGDIFGVRYNEALALEAAYQRRRADRIESRIASLETKIDKALSA